MWTTHGLARAIVFSLIVLVLLVVLIGIALVSTRDGASGGPSGSIVISSVTDPGLPFLDNYVFDVGSRHLAKITLSDSSQENMYSFSPDARFVTFMGTTQDEVRSMIASHQHGDPMQVYYARVDNDSGPFPVTAKAQRLTQDITQQKISPVISDDGRTVLYTSRIATTSRPASDHSLNGYTIRSISDDLTSSALTINGARPQWYSNSVFFYLADDGLRAYDIVSATSTMLISTRSQLNNKIAISPDRRLLAFADPDSRTVFMYTISAHGYALTNISSINLAGYWVIFSPDGAYMAVQTADNGSPQLVIYDTVDFTQIGDPIQLTSLNNDRLFITAWLR